MSLSRENAIEAILRNEAAYCDMIKIDSINSNSSQSSKIEYFQRTWEVYDATLRAASIIMKRGGKIGNALFAKIYTFIYNIITHSIDLPERLGYPQELNSLIQKIINHDELKNSNYVKNSFISFCNIWYNILNEKYQQNRLMDSFESFKNFLEFWTEFQALISCSKKWTSYVRGKYIENYLKFDNLYLVIFQKVFFNRTSRQENYNAFVNIYNDLRNDKSQSLSLLKDFITIILQLKKNIYQKLEKKFLESSVEFYTVRVVEIQRNDIYTITQHNQEIFKKENEMMQIFNTETQHAITELLKNILIVDNLESFSGIYFLIKEYLQTSDEKTLGQIIEIIKMYNFAANHLLCSYITEIINLEIASLNSPDKISHVLNWSKIYDNYFHLASRINNDNFSQTIQKELKRNFNVKYQESEIAEVLSFFCDVLMKPNFEKIINLTREQGYITVSNLVSLLIDKDLFINYYRQDLSVRLLESQNINMDEKEFTSVLKLNHGYNLIMRLENMFTDRVMSKEFFEMFKEFCSKKRISVDKSFSVLVLSSGSWPRMSIEKVKYPDVVSNSIAIFESYYQQQNNNNKILQWIPEKSTCTLTSTFESNRYEMNMTCFQGIIMMLFNEYSSLSLSEIINITNIPLTEAKRSLVGLVCGKYKILQGSNKVEMTDRYTVNDKFSDKKKKISIPLPKIVVVKKQIVEETNKNRNYIIDAAIVRIMKARRKISHMELFTEVMSQIKLFRVEPKNLKMAIEELITREYISRDPNSNNLYNYVA